jgi:hypothetical protein
MSEMESALNKLSSYDPATIPSGGITASKLQRHKNGKLYSQDDINRSVAELDKLRKVLN